MIPLSPPPSPPRCVARRPCPGRNDRPARIPGRRRWRRRPPADRMARRSRCHLPCRRLPLLSPPLNAHWCDEHALETLRNGCRSPEDVWIEKQSCARHDAESWASTHRLLPVQRRSSRTGWMAARAAAWMLAGHRYTLLCAAGDRRSTLDRRDGARSVSSGTWPGTLLPSGDLFAGRAPRCLRVLPRLDCDVCT